MADPEWPWLGQLGSTPHVLTSSGSTPGFIHFLEAEFQDRAEKCTKALRSAVIPFISYWPQHIKILIQPRSKVEKEYPPLDGMCQRHGYRKRWRFGANSAKGLPGVNFNLKFFMSMFTFNTGMISEKTVKLNYVSTVLLWKFYSKGQAFLQR